MKVVDVEEYLKHDFTEEEVKERVAWFQDLSRRFDKANQESPMPDDILDYCEGRKFRPMTLEQLAAVKDKLRREEEEYE
jgi:hypothetical protein